ncbi:MAG: hypothetical protein KDD62_01005 [Bdellovibrionales bacterium]|nr:hypothetical protein [Bdellovibrionales bacterium]
MNDVQKKYSHIYVEEAVWDAADTLRLQSLFTHAHFIQINSYKEIFNRSKQDWREQKRSQKLILANREHSFLYPCSDIAPDFQHKNFYYTTPAINCLYDCSYCYLQGLYSSAYAVCFLNHQDFFISVKKTLDSLGSLYLCISYDTDLLAFETIIPYCRLWIEFARQNPQLTIEVRTKSGNFSAIQDLVPCPNVILAWTLSPPSIQKCYEPLTPSLAARIKAVNKALDVGWNVRLCFDPMIWTPNLGNPYPEFLKEIQTQIEFARLYDLYFGVFRMNEDQLRNIQKQRSDTDILYQAFTKENKVVSYSKATNQQLRASV